MNEKDGLIHSIKAHNLALIERVRDLGRRIESMQHVTIETEKMKD